MGSGNRGTTTPVVGAGSRHVAWGLLLEVSSLQEGVWGWAGQQYEEGAKDPGCSRSCQRALVRAVVGCWGAPGLRPGEHAEDGLLREWASSGKAQENSVSTEAGS